MATSASDAAHAGRPLTTVLKVARPGSLLFHIRLSALAVSNLPAPEGSSTSMDPYLVWSLESSNPAAQTVSNRLAPRQRARQASWPDVFELDVTVSDEEALSAQHLHIECWDHNLLSDTLVGAVRVDLRTLCTGPPHYQLFLERQLPSERKRDRLRMGWGRRASRDMDNIGLAIASGSSGTPLPVPPPPAAGFSSSSIASMLTRTPTAAASSPSPFMNVDSAHMASPSPGLSSPPPLLPTTSSSGSQAHGQYGVLSFDIVMEQVTQASVGLENVSLTLPTVDVEAAYLLEIGTDMIFASKASQQMVRDDDVLHIRELNAAPNLLTLPELYNASFFVHVFEATRMTIVAETTIPFRDSRIPLVDGTVKLDVPLTLCNRTAAAAAGSGVAMLKAALRFKGLPRFMQLSQGVCVGAGILNAGGMHTWMPTQPRVPILSLASPLSYDAAACTPEKALPVTQRADDKDSVPIPRPSVPTAGRGA